MCCATSRCPTSTASTRALRVVVVEYAHVKDSGGHTERRPVIETLLRMGNRGWRVRVTLTDRGDMRFPMLVGRTALGPDMRVHPTRRFLDGTLIRRPRAIYPHTVVGEHHDHTPPPRSRRGAARRSSQGWARRWSSPALILVAEAVGGWLTHSLALLSDAGHMFSDVVARRCRWRRWSSPSRPADARRTYGWHRVEILAALGNGLVLWCSPSSSSGKAGAGCTRPSRCIPR